MADRTPADSKGSLRAAVLRQWKKFRENTEEFLAYVHKKGRERLTIMVIPHTEKKILNLHVSVYAVSITGALVLVILLISIVSLAGKSGEDIQLYDMGLTNSQFNIQGTKMAEEMIPLHEVVTRYTNSIAELYLKLDGSEGEVAGQGGAAQGLLDSEVKELDKLVQLCKSKGDSCDQHLTEEILRRIIFLSKQDNQNLKRAVELSDKILGELKSREKQNLLKHTPSIWPTKGYLLSPYGWQIDQIEGRRTFKRGIEIGAPLGTEVYATAPGIITSISYDKSYGLHVWVGHRYGMKTMYGHLDRVRVAIGDKVSKGQVIGHVGRTGNTPISQLYYEVHVGTVAYNPHSFLNHLQDQWLTQPKL
ncbi:MAG: M23 family metallopeptidase [Spirochaetia bacterium]|nr:M23 family metallopeptidase [Spirochaetia bacterium]